MDLVTTRNRVQEYLVDLPTETQALIDSWINQAIRSAEDRYNFRYMGEMLSAETTVATRKLDDKPALWKEAGSAPWLQFNDGASREIMWAPSQSEMVRQYSETDTDDDGQPAFILETEDELLVYPFPDGDSDWPDDEYRLRVPYWSYSATLSGDGDHAQVMNLAPYYAVFYAVAEGLIFNRDEGRAGGYAQKAEIEFRRAVNRDKRSRLPDRMTLVPSGDVYGRAAHRRRLGGRRWL